MLNWHTYFMGNLRPKIEKILKEGCVVVMPTDTLYGIVGRAENQDTVKRIYEIRKRNPKKPCIILIGDVSELEKFSISLSEGQKKVLKELWSTPTSVILDCLDDSLKYLHRGTKTLAFRLPKDEGLRNLLKQTGPLIAPSANTEGYTPAKDISEAKKYFASKHTDLINLYVDGGTILGKASKVVKLHKDGGVSILRE